MILFCHTFWFTEVFKSWQRDYGVGDEVDGVESAAEVVRLTGLNTTYIAQALGLGSDKDRQQWEKSDKMKWKREDKRAIHEDNK